MADTEAGLVTIRWNRVAFGSGIAANICLSVGQLMTLWAAT